MTSFEVGIIGAGIHGASAAYHLAARAVSTVVFEKTVPAGGPTGRSSAICRAYYTNEFLAGVARESIDMLRELGAVDGNDPGYRETGLLYLHPADDAQELEHNAERLNALDVEVELLDAARL